jgi:hypothetical protein
LEVDRRRTGVRRRTVLAAVGAGCTLLSSRRAYAADPAYLDPGAPLADRVDAILAVMTDSQKLTCLTGRPATTLLDGYQLSPQGSGPGHRAAAALTAPTRRMDTWTVTHSVESVGVPFSAASWA